MLYEFVASPYCCTVRALLNLSRIPYTIVPVDMGSKAELKFSKYKKVPIITVNSLQINDSEQIMKVLSPICFGRNCTEVEIAQIEEIGRLGASAFTLDMFEDAKIRKRCIGRFMNPGGCVGCLIQVNLVSNISSERAGCVPRATVRLSRPPAGKAAHNLYGLS